MVKAINEDLKAALGGVWQCVVGMDTHYGHCVQPATDFYLLVAFGELLVVIFKALMWSKHGSRMLRSPKMRRGCGVSNTNATLLKFGPVQASLEDHPAGDKWGLGMVGMREPWGLENDG